MSYREVNGTPESQRQLTVSQRDSIRHTMQAAMTVLPVIVGYPSSQEDALWIAQQSGVEFHLYRARLSLRLDSPQVVEMRFVGVSFKRLLADARKLLLLRQIVKSCYVLTRNFSSCRRYSTKIKETSHEMVLETR